MKKISVIYIITLLLFCSWGLYAQATQFMAIDILSGINDGSIQVSAEPLLTNNTVENIFDGNPYTEAGVQDDSSAAVTLQFSAEVSFSKCKLFFWNAGQWTLEAAQSMTELDNKTGSYQIIVDNRDNPFFQWDSLEFSQVSAQVIRITEKNPAGPGVHFGEIELVSQMTFTALTILPNPVRLIPNSSFRLKVELMAENGRSYPYTLDNVVRWSSSDLAVAEVGEMGDVMAKSIGTAIITADIPGLSGSATLEVVEDFESVNAEQLYVKVALVLQDPVIDSTSMKRVHEVWNWGDPVEYAYRIAQEFYNASEGVVKFDIVEIHDDDKLFSRLGDELMTVDTLAYYYMTPGMLYGRTVTGTLQNLSEVQGVNKFDYNAMIDYYNFDEKRNNGEIDEVWVYAHPFAGMYESQLVGPGAFWWNSPPLDNPNLEKMLSVMGWNFERDVDCAIHSVCHRAESALRHVYGRWECTNPDPNPWELFTRLDKDLPGLAHVGNCHFPPNGAGDYDYSNHTAVLSYADNWKRYPILLDQTREIDCSEWGCTQLGYMRWWFNHLPRYTGVTDGVLNNWWHYFIDYEGAVAKAENWTSIENENKYESIVPGDFTLSQNYPNPFNPETVIEYQVQQKVSIDLAVYNILGQRVRTLKKGFVQPGFHKVIWNGKNEDGQQLPNGIYFCKLIVSNGNSSAKKMILLK